MEWPKCYLLRIFQQKKWRKKHMQKLCKSTNLSCQFAMEKWSTVQYINTGISLVKWKDKEICKLKMKRVIFWHRMEDIDYEKKWFYGRKVERVIMPKQNFYIDCWGAIIIIISRFLDDYSDHNYNWTKGSLRLNLFIIFVLMILSPVIQFKNSKSFWGLICFLNNKN